MKKNTFFEKLGKLTFSIILTGALVTGVVLAGTTWQTYNDADIVSGTEWQKMVTEIQNKVNSLDLPDFSQFYTKTESDDKFLTQVNIPTIVMDMGTFQGSSGLSRKVTKPICLSGYSPKIQVNLDWFETVGDVNGDDIIGTWNEDKGSYWYINGGDYDCGKLSGTRIIKGCSSYNDSKISYTAYCSSIAKTSPVCGSSSGTCNTGIPSIVNNGVWTCTEGSISKNCGTFVSPCSRSNPPSYCNR